MPCLLCLCALPRDVFVSFAWRGTCLELSLARFPDPDSHIVLFYFDGDEKIKDRADQPRDAAHVHRIRRAHIQVAR